MKISHELPPNWNEIVRKFGSVWGKVAVTYGDTVHSKHTLSSDLLVHEAVHVEQQKYPSQWWEKYYNDKGFRFSQELEAYKAQFKYFKSVTTDRNLLFKVRDKLARDLSGKLYGYVCEYDEAYKMIGEK